MNVGPEIHNSMDIAMLASKISSKGTKYTLKSTMKNVTNTKR